MDPNFVRADNSNLPKIDSFMVANFFKSNTDYYAAEFKNVRGGSTGPPPPAAPASMMEEKRSPLQPQQQGRAPPQPAEPVAPPAPKPAVVKAKTPRVNQNQKNKGCSLLKHKSWIIIIYYPPVICKAKDPTKCHLSQISRLIGTLLLY
ncbi:hypothetical protein ACJJTC_019427 [Scirpophaga incertulas]